jgi:hypothetical protein
MHMHMLHVHMHMRMRMHMCMCMCMCMCMYFSSSHKIPSIKSTAIQIKEGGVEPGQFQIFWRATRPHGDNTNMKMNLVGAIVLFCNKAH